MWKLFSIVTVLAIFCNTDITEALVGGNDAQPNQFPYAVAILEKNSPQQVMCGGVILDNVTILTHQRCVPVLNDLQVFCGELNLENRTSENLYDIDYSINYASSYLTLLKLGRALNFDDGTVARVDLPSDSPPVGINMTIMSWGSTEANNLHDDANTLQYLDLVSISGDECSQTWSFLKPYFQFCTINDQISTGPCPNDIGAPLVANNTLYGILAKTSDSCVGKDPNIFINVYNQLSWIQPLINN